MSRPEVTGRKSTPNNPLSDDADDLVWGAKDIGSEINRSPAQVYHLLAIGALEGAAVKLDHKTIVGSRKQLRNLVGLHAKKGF